MRTLLPAARTLIVPLALPLAVAGCPSKREGPPPKPSASASAPSAVASAPPPPVDTAALARRFTDCQQSFSRGDLAELTACYAPGAVSRWLDSGLPDEKGPAAIIDNRKKALRTAFPDAKLVPQLVLVNGHEVASTGVLSGVHSGPLMAADGVIAATKKPIGQLAFQAALLDRAGAVIEESLLVDRASLAFQLGLDKHKGRAVNTQGLVGGPRIIPATGDATERLNRAVVDRQWHALSEENLPAFAASLADDVVLADQTAPEDARGKGAVVKAVDVWLRGLGSITITCPTLWAAGAYVVSVCRVEAVNDGDLPGFKQTGKRVSLNVAEVARLDGGLEREIFRFADGARLASELGPDKDGGAPAKSKP